MEANNLLHVEKCIEMFPELEDNRKEAIFQIYKGLVYQAYIFDKKKEALFFFGKASFLRPSFFFEGITVFLKKYLFRQKQIR